MYNGIGLYTPRGSGTSGYVQKNLAFVRTKQMTNNYKEILQQFKANPAPTKKRANLELIEHELKHKIEVELFNYAEELKSKNTSPKEIENLVAAKRTALYNKLKRNSNEFIE
jgi:serine/arginine repetitive matrix protein 2